jgi:aminopeptidase N
VRTFGNAWPTEDNDSVLSRTALTLLGRIIPTFLPPQEHDWAGRVVADAAATSLLAADAGSTRALVAARTLARSSADESLLRAWAAGKDRPAGLEEDSDFGWIAVRNLASRGLVDLEFVEGRRADDDTLQGRLNALVARASMPTADAKEWAWSELTANRSRSNYELNALAQGFWLTDDLDVVRPYAQRYFTEVPAMTAWVGEDAIARVATLAYPARVVEEATLELSAAALAGGRLSVAVRRSVVDAQSELREALRSRATFG